MKQYISYKELSNVQKEGDQLLPQSNLKIINQVNAIEHLDWLKLYFQQREITKEDMLYVTKFFLRCNQYHSLQEGKYVFPVVHMKLNKPQPECKKIYKHMLIGQDFPLDPFNQIPSALINNNHALQEQIIKNLNICKENKYVQSFGWHAHHHENYNIILSLLGDLLVNFNTLNLHHTTPTPHYFLSFEISAELKKMAKFLLKQLEEEEIYQWVHDGLLSIKNNVAGIYGPDDNIPIKVEGNYNKVKQMILSNFANQLTNIIQSIQHNDTLQAEENLLTLISHTLESGKIIGLNLMNVIFKTKHQYDGSKYQSFIEYAKNHNELKQLLQGDLGKLLLLMISNDDLLSLDKLQISLNKDGADNLISTFLDTEEVKEVLVKIPALLNIIHLDSQIIFAVLKGIFNQHQEVIGEAIDLYNQKLQSQQLEVNLQNIQEGKPLSQKMLDFAQLLQIPTTQFHNVSTINQIIKHGFKNTTIDKIKMDLGIIPNHIVFEALDIHSPETMVSQEEATDFVQSIIGTTDLFFVEHS